MTVKLEESWLKLLADQFEQPYFKQIKEKLSKYNLDKKQIIVDNPITSLGFHEIKINLYKDIIAKIKIEVKK